jgi:hypothetical protein
MITQADKIEHLFKTRPYSWIPCYDLIKYSLQYNARIFELRGRGMVIENKTKTENGQKKSWYRYIPDGQRRLF